MILTSSVNISSLRGSYFGVGSTPILLDGVQCNGTESRLDDCMQNGEISCSQAPKNAGVSSVACKGMV